VHHLRHIHVLYYGFLDLHDFSDCDEFLDNDLYLDDTGHFHALNYHICNYLWDRDDTLLVQRHLHLSFNYLFDLLDKRYDLCNYPLDLAILHYWYELLSNYIDLLQDCCLAVDGHYLLDDMRYFDYSLHGVLYYYYFFDQTLDLFYNSVEFCAAFPQHL
jgi:hypothetical protein